MGIFQENPNFIKKKTFSELILNFL